METKKSRKANLEKSRSTFLLIGLIAATTLLIFAFNWESVKIVDVDNGRSGVEIDEMIDIASTTPDELEKKPEKKEVIKKVVAEVIQLVDDTTSVSEINELWTVGDDPVIDEPVVTEEPGKIWESAERMPKFPGGERALMLFIAKNVVYPMAAKENNIQGTVNLRFEVTKTGKVGKIEIYSIYEDELLIKSAKDVIKKLPKFKPGMQNGIKVNVWFSIPITFKLN